jgi:hypothetical protein
VDTIASSPYVDAQGRPFRSCAVPACPARFVHEHPEASTPGRWCALRAGLTGWLCPDHAAPVLNGTHRNGMADVDRQTNAARLTCTCGEDLGPASVQTCAEWERRFLTHLTTSFRTHIPAGTLPSSSTGGEGRAQTLV